MGSFNVGCAITDGMICEGEEVYLIPIQNGALYCVCHKSMYSPLPDDYIAK